MNRSTVQAAQTTEPYSKAQHAEALGRLLGDIALRTTGGKWTWEESDVQGFRTLFLRGPEGQSLRVAAEVPTLDKVDGMGDFLRTISLISAAPDLLAVCQEIAEHGTDDWDARMTTLRAAITKATT